MGTGISGRENSRSEGLEAVWEGCVGPQRVRQRMGQTGKTDGRLETGVILITDDLEYYSEKM